MPVVVATLLAEAGPEHEVLAAKTGSLEAELRRSRHEAAQLDLVRVANEDELAELRGKVGELGGRCAEQAASMRQSAGLALSYTDLQQAHQQALSEAAAWHAKLDAAHADAEGKRAEQLALLERLLAGLRECRLELRLPPSTAFGGFLCRRVRVGLIVPCPSLGKHLFPCRCSSFCEYLCAVCSVARLARCLLERAMLARRARELTERRFLGHRSRTA